jgi:mannose-P-dolichol utilization defect protein 1
MLEYFSSFVKNQNLDISYLISKSLGYLIVIFSITLKLPQIWNMRQIKSDRGLSYLTMYTEIFIYLFCFLYGYRKGNPFSTYGENVFILIQSLFIILLCWKYGQKSSTINKLFRAIFMILLALITIKCVDGKGIPEYVWTILATSPIPLSSIGRMSQIFVSFREKDTGSLSSITYLLGFLGSITRIFTTYTETGDKIIIATFVYGAFLNLIILIQIVMYGDKSRKITAKEKLN